VPDQVKTRTYKSALRAQQAAATRRAVLVAARDLFGTRGYAETPVREVAARAGVSVDTVYAAVGRKPQLLLAVLDMTLAGGDEPVPAEERDYVRAVRAAETAEQKVAIYARALAGLLPRTAPLLLALKQAAEDDEECARVRRQVDERRAANMRLFAADLRAAGGVRDDLTDAEVADLVWATNSVEYFDLLASRGWDAGRVAVHLEDLWTRLLLSR
jgi:AcrR family transcriptional regulator